MQSINLNFLFCFETLYIVLAPSNAPTAKQGPTAKAAVPPTPKETKAKEGIPLYKFHGKPPVETVEECDLPKGTAAKSEQCSSLDGRKKALPVKGRPATAQQELRKQAFEEQRGPPKSKSIRESGKERRQNKKREEKLNKLRALDTPKVEGLPPDLPKEIPVAMPEPQGGDSILATLAMAAAAELDMRETLSEGESILKETTNMDEDLWHGI